MNNDKFEQLVRDHPSIFEKSGDFEFSIGDGWYTIINTLLHLICHNAEQAKLRLKFALENPGHQFTKPIEYLEERVAEEIEKLPTIVQIKEKYGGLRFYVDGGTPEVHAYIEFAEAMSYHSCEECGSPGSSRNDGWIKVLCDKHYKEKEEESVPGNYPRRRTVPNLFTE